MQSDKEIKQLTQKFDFFKKDLNKETTEKILFGRNIFLSSLNKSASFINWFLVNPLMIISFLLILKTISLDDINQFYNANKPYFSQLGFVLFSTIISLEMIGHFLRIFICPPEKIKPFLKRTVISLITTILTYKIIEVSWVNIANII